MKLLVRVIEAKNLPAMDQNGFSDPYVKLRLGKQKFKTKVVKKNLNPSWYEEFNFRVDDMKGELQISVLDEDKYFHDDFVGQIKVPIARIFDAPDNSLGTSWYTLRPKHNKKSKTKDCGEILVTILLSQSNLLLDLHSVGDHAPLTRKSGGFGTESPSRSFNSLQNRTAASSPVILEEAAAPLKDEKSLVQTFAGRIAQMFSKNEDNTLLPPPPPATSIKNPADTVNQISNPVVVVDDDKHSDDQALSCNFEEIIKSMEAKEQEEDGVSTNLSGGVVLEQLHAISPHDLNSLLFSPDSNFLKSVMDAQGSTELLISPWQSHNSANPKRVITYIKAASALVKALKATEEQTYLKVDGKTFAVLSSVSTPDAPYGSTFKTEVLYCITLGPELPSGEQTSQLVVSWRMNFLQTTMMKGMIEKGARPAIKESLKVYGDLLAQNVKLVDLKDIGSEKEQVLASIKVEQQSDWKLAVQYFANFTVVSTILVGLYVLLHISLATQRLEFFGLDLPDSISELVVTGVLVLQGKRMLELISRFMQAKAQKGSDHGIKAQGDGWLLTVALIEGNNLTTVDPSGFTDPYVVFTCNGKTRTSSIKFQKSDPRWNEIFEFDAMDEPPSVLDVEVFDFDGPYDDATSIGHAEINFLKTNLSDLSDVWIPLQGKLSQACQSRLHLRIFLNNTRGKNVINDYLSKMEKEVGKKIKPRSPQANSSFQKLFGLPPEEFLIDDFNCHLKPKKMPNQGRIYLSARIFGFYSDLFGHKTKFFFLWEDIEDIRIFTPTLSSMGSPSIVMTLKPGKGFDARHCAKAQDEEGRLKFHFQSFVSFSAAKRTIKALWKDRLTSPEQKTQIVEAESEDKNVQTSEEEFVSKKDFQATDEDPETKSLTAEEIGSYLGIEDVKMSRVYSSELCIPASFLMELFGESELDQKVMVRAGCLNYSHGPWESETSDMYQRQVYYKFDEHIFQYSGEVTSTQQKSRLLERNGWVVEEIMTLHGDPLSDYFSIHLKYQVEDISSRSTGCSVQVYVGIAWSKHTRYRKSISKNILSSMVERILIMFRELEKEYISRNNNNNNT